MVLCDQCPLVVRCLARGPLYQRKGCHFLKFECAVCKQLTVLVQPFYYEDQKIESYQIGMIPPCLDTKLVHQNFPVGSCLACRTKEVEKEWKSAMSVLGPVTS